MKTKLTLQEKLRDLRDERRRHYVGLETSIVYRKSERGEKGMCMMLYLGADNELPYIKWKDGAVFAVTDIHSSYNAVLKHMTKKYQYFLLAHTGCGCGFTFDYTNEQFDEETNALGKKSLSTLFDYIVENIASDNCELVSFWAGKENEEIRHSDELDLSDFVFNDSFAFLENQYIFVRSKNIKR